MAKTCLWLLLLSLSTLANCEEYVELPSRNNHIQPFLYLEHKQALATVILFAGGRGMIKLYPGGSTEQLSKNFLVRSRQLFLQQKLNVVVFEAPSHKHDDFGLLNGYRRSKAHAKDIALIVDFLKQKSSLPIWLIGTSRGAVSAANGAGRLSDQISGLVLTSSVSVNNKRGATVFDTPLSKIRVPVLIASHKDDRCRVTPPKNDKRIAKRLKKATEVKVQHFKGGLGAQGRDCGGQGPHGFLGIEAEVVRSISQFILSRP